MFQFLSRLFVTTREIEADLRPTPGCSYGGKGEVELETRSNGTASLEASLKHCGLPDGAEVEVYRGEDHVTSLVVRGGFAHSTLSGETGGAELAAVGDEVTFRYQGETIYSGTFRPD